MSLRQTRAPGGSRFSWERGSAAPKEPGAMVARDRIWLSIGRDRTTRETTMSLSAKRTDGASEWMTPSITLASKWCCVTIRCSEPCPPQRLQGMQRSLSAGRAAESGCWFLSSPGDKWPRELTSLDECYSDFIISCSLASVGRSLGGNQNGGAAIGLWAVVRWLLDLQFKAPDLKCYPRCRHDPRDRVDLRVLEPEAIQRAIDKLNCRRRTASVVSLR